MLISILYVPIVFEPIFDRFSLQIHRHFFFNPRLSVANRRCYQRMSDAAVARHSESCKQTLQRRSAEVPAEIFEQRIVERKMKAKLRRTRQTISGRDYFLVARFFRVMLSDDDLQ